MFGRKAAYLDGYLKSLDQLKSLLFEDVEKRIKDRNPHTLESLSYTVMDLIHKLEDEAIGDLKC